MKKRSNVSRIPGAERIEALELENHELRKTLFAMLKTLGRVRVPKEAAASLREGDGMGVRELTDAWVFTFQPSEMVVPGGVTNGAANRDKKEGA